LIAEFVTHGYVLPPDPRCAVRSSIQLMYEGRAVTSIRYLGGGASGVQGDISYQYARMEELAASFDVRVCAILLWHGQAAT
jgi:hypothetical protein